MALDMTREGSVDPPRDECLLPDIADDDDFRCVIQKLSKYFRSVIEFPSTFEQLRTTAAGACLHELVEYLHATCRNPAIVNALLALKWHYDADRHNQMLSEARSSACEIAAWRFLACFSDKDAMRLCLYEIPDAQAGRRLQQDRHGNDEEHTSGETAPLLDRRATHRSAENGYVSHFPWYLSAGSSSRRSLLLDSVCHATGHDADVDSDPAAAAIPGDDNDPTVAFRNLNGLEIAAIAGAKRFLGQGVVQRIVAAIWHGDIVFWDSLSPRATKCPKLYDPHTADPFSRLRVPKYLKSYEAGFFVVFLCLYYAVLIQRVLDRITATEAVLWVWIAAFCYDEFSEWLDAGSVFYVTDIWNVCDVIMMILAFIFAVLRIIGVVQADNFLNGLAFDILALEALFLVPRICSVLSLSPSWGILIPCLKEMTIDFIKFMVIILIIYCGFLTTFSLLGRDHFTLMGTAGILGKIFFGSSYVGFEVMDAIDPVFGPPLMIVFIALSTFLLMGSLAGLLANSFARVMNEAHDEYLYVYSVYVLEASTSNRLTHFYPPFNLIALLMFRPWRLVLRRDEAFRSGRIWLLKVTHAPIVLVIRLYEMLTRRDGVKEPPRLSGSLVHPVQGYPYVRPRSAVEPGLVATPRRAKQQRPVAFSQEGTAVEQESPKQQSLISVEMRVDELSKKIDRLTDMIMSMQPSREPEMN